MSTVIVYATKYGCTKKCAEMLADKLGGDLELHDLRREKSLDLAKYDKVIIGGSIYIGKIRPEVTRFCSNNLGELKKKTIGLFICGIRSGEAAQTELTEAFPSELVSAAAAKECFGGELIYNKMGFLDRQITKMVAKSGDDSFPKLDTNRNASMLDLGKIEQFVQAMAVA